MLQNTVACKRLVAFKPGASIGSLAEVANFNVVLLIQYGIVF